MKKTLFAAAVLAAGITQVAQAAPIERRFIDNAPAKSVVTITFSGDCSGKITDTGAKVETGLADDHASGKWSYFRFTTTGMSGLVLDNIWFTQSAGSTTKISISKGMLNAKLSDTSAANSGGDIRKIHTSGADSQIQCKNGQTLNELLNSMGRDMKYVRDTTMTQKTNISLKGNEEPYAYTLSHTISGYLLMTVDCDISSVSAGSIENDSYQSSCTLAPKVKVTMKATVKGLADEI